MTILMIFLQFLPTILRGRLLPTTRHRVGRKEVFL